MTPLFAAVNWLNISINLLLVIHVIVCLLLALVVLMQRPKQEGLGAAFGSGLTDQAFGARTTDVLQKGTVYLGTLFFVITLVLAILIGKRQNTNPSITDTVAKTEETKPAADAPVVLPKQVTETAPAEKSEAPKAPKADDSKKADSKAETAPAPAETPKASDEKKATTDTPAPATPTEEKPAEPTTGDQQ